MIPNATEKGRGLQLDNVRVGLDGQTLVAISTHIPVGGSLTVMGPSGSGKSSLLAYIGGFLDPAFHATGQVFANGLEITSLPAAERHAGILFQDPLLFPHLSVRSNLVFALPSSLSGRALRRNRADQALASVGLEGFGPRDPATLSGGQKARVALARTLASEPRLLLLDEPFSKLDMALRGQMRDLVFTTAREAGLPVVLVTHDEADAEAAGGEIHYVGGDQS